MLNKATAKGKEVNDMQAASLPHRLLCMVCALAMVSSMTLMPTGKALAAGDLDQGPADQLAPQENGAGSDDTSNSQDVGGGSLTGSPFDFVDDETFEQWQAEEGIAAASLDDEGIMPLATNIVPTAGGTIDVGGTWYLDGSYGLKTVTITTSDPVTLRPMTTGTTFTSVPQIVYADGVNANLTLNGLSYQVSAPGVPVFKFADGTTNTLTITGTNTLSFAKNGSAKSNALIEVNQGTTLNIAGTGTLNLYPYMAGVAIGSASTAKANGTINFGLPGASSGPTINLCVYNAVGIGSYTSSTAPTAAVGPTLNPGAISFNAGTYNFAVSGAARIIGLGNRINPDLNRKLKITIADNVTMNIAQSGAFGTSSGTSAPPIGANSLYQNLPGGLYNPFDLDDPFSGGTLVIGSGAQVRYYATAAGTYCDGWPVPQGWTYNGIMMALVSPSDPSTPLVGYALDLEALAEMNPDFDWNGGEYTYSIDGGASTFYNCWDHTFDASSAGSWSNISGIAASYAAAKPEMQLPLFLTPESHTITINDSVFMLNFKNDAVAGKYFSLEELSYGIEYDLNDADSKYKATNDGNPSEFKSSTKAFELAAPQREGYDFDGWFDADGKQWTVIDPAEVNTDLELTAHWSRIELSITYDFWEGGQETATLEYGKDIYITVYGAEDVSSLYRSEVTFAEEVPCPLLPEAGFTTVGYKPSYDAEGNLVLAVRSGMPEECQIAIEQPEAGCPIWVIVDGVKYDSGTITVPNGTEVNLQAYPEDGYEFNSFTVDGEPLLDAEGRASFDLTVKEHMTIGADVRLVRYIKASIPEDEGMTLVDDDANKGERISADGVRYRIIKTGIRYVKGEAEYVKDYPVYNGDPLYEGDVITCIGSIDDSIQPEDVNYEYVGPVRFSFNGSDPADSAASYRVVGDEGTTGILDPEAQAGSLEIASAMPKLELKNWLHIADTSWYNNETSVFLLSTPEQLAGMAQLINDGNFFKGKTIALANDISLANNDGTAGKRYWVPRDYSSSWINSFQGTFDGQGHTVSGLLMEGSDAVSYNGLFAKVEGGTVKDLTVEGDIALPATSGKIVYYTGLIAGYADEGATIENCTARGTVAARQYTGGIVGLANAATKGTAIKGCRFEGSIVGYSIVGGIVGAMQGNGVVASDCVNAGTVAAVSSIGGIAGSIPTSRNVINNVAFTNCMNTGTLTLQSTSASQGISTVVGGILGIASSQVSFDSCYNTGRLIAEPTSNYSNNLSMGGIIGYGSDGLNLANCANTGNVETNIGPDAVASTGERNKVVWAGGLVGYMSSSSETQPSTIDACYNTGTVDTGYAGDKDYVSASGAHTNPQLISGNGGLVGAVSSGQGQIAISNSYVSGDLLWKEGANSIVGQPFIPGGLIGLLCTPNMAIYKAAPASSLSAGLYLSNNYFETGIAGGATTVGNAKTRMVNSVQLPAASPLNAAVNGADEGIMTLSYTFNEDRTIGRQVFEGFPTDAATAVVKASNGQSLETGVVLAQGDLISTVTGLTDANGNLLYKVEEGFNRDLPIFGGQQVVTFTVLGSDGSTVGTFTMLTGESLSPDEVTERLGGAEPTYAGEVPAGYSSYGHFDGYSTSPDAMVPLTNIVVTSEVSATTLYALFSGEAIEYKINYNNIDGAEFSTELTTFTVESPELTLTRVVPTREDDEFLGWYDGADLETANPVYVIAAGTVGDVELYAHWKSEIPVDSGIRAITYHLNGGTNAVDAPLTYTVGTALTLPTPSRSGYVFDGWYANPELTGGRISAISAAATDDVEVWAGWTKVIIQTGGDDATPTPQPPTGGQVTGTYPTGGYVSTAAGTYSGSFTSGSAAAAAPDDVDLTSVEEDEEPFAGDDVESFSSYEEKDPTDAISDNANPLATMGHFSLFDWLPWVLAALFAAAAAAGWLLFAAKKRKDSQDMYGNVQ